MRLLGGQHSTASKKTRDLMHAAVQSGKVHMLLQQLLVRRKGGSLKQARRHGAELQDG